MEKEIIFKMKKYLNAQITTGIIIFIIGILMLVVFLALEPVFGITPLDGLENFIWLTFILSFLTSITGVVEKFKLRKQLKALEESGELRNVLNDFEFAEPMYNGAVMLGKRYIYGKKCTAIVNYCDIERMYIYTHTSKSMVDQRILKAQLKNGRHVKLCYLQLHNPNSEDEQAVINAILRHNSFIMLMHIHNE